MAKSVWGALLAAVLVPAHGATLLYSQDFESPVNFVDDGGNVNVFRTVNDLYSNQPPGFVFAQTFTVETLLVGGSVPFGQGFQDPQARAGKYVLGLLSTAQDDYLGLAFNVGAFKFLNFQLDISSIDLDRWGGPFVPTGGAAPTFRFSLFDNPGGANGIGSGSALSFADVSGLVAPNKYTFNWLNQVVALDATGNTNGNVILRVDLLSGGYAAMDNFLIAASDTPGEVPGIPAIPEPTTYVLMALGLGFLALARRRREV